MAIQDADKLRVYNHALQILGSRRLASLTEAREARFVLDERWGTADEFVLFNLGRADWNFATRTVAAAHNPGIETGFGYRYVYDKPSDMVRLSALSADPYFNATLTAEEYRDQAGYWLMDYESIYVAYVSNDLDYGFDSTLWPETFRRLMAGQLAYDCCERITNSTQKMAMAKSVMRDSLGHARSRDSMDEGVKFQQRGAWVISRGRASGWRAE